MKYIMQYIYYLYIYIYTIISYSIYIYIYIYKYTQKVFGAVAFSPLQIGLSAGQKILDSLLDGLQIESNGCLMIIDLNPGVGNLFDAFVAKRSTTNFSLQYVAVMDDVSAEWFAETKAGNS